VAQAARRSFGLQQGGQVNGDVELRGAASFTPATVVTFGATNLEFLPPP